MSAKGSRRGRAEGMEKGSLREVPDADSLLSARCLFEAKAA